MDAVDSAKNTFSGLLDSLKENGFAVLEAGADKLGNDIIDRLSGRGDSLPPAQSAQQTVLPEYGAAPTTTQTANPVGGFSIGGVQINGTILAVSVALLAGALILKGR